MKNSTVTVSGVQWSTSSMIGFLGLDETNDLHGCDYFEIFGSFVCFLVFLYGMAKVVQASERYFSQYMLCCQNHLTEIEAMSYEWELTLQLCEADMLWLEGEVVTQSEKHLQLQGILAEIRSCTSYLINENLKRSVIQKQNIPAVPSNIYITNRHLYISRQVFFNEGQRSVVRNTSAGGEVSLMKGLSVCMEYLNMMKNSTESSSMVGPFGLAETSDLHGCSFLEICGSFLQFLLLLNGMVKFMQTYERVLIEHMLLCCQNQQAEIQAMKREWELTLQLCEVDKASLDGEVVTQSEKHVQLEVIRVEISSCNLYLINENLKRYVLQQQNIPAVPSNIYITKSHFYISRQVFINDGQRSGVRNTSAGGEVSLMKGLSVWMEYLKMRNYNMGPIAAEELQGIN